MRMPSPAARPSDLTDSYFDLVRVFPLTRIGDDAHLTEAQKVLECLLQQDLNSGADAYLDALSDAIEPYEDETIPPSDATPAEILQELLNANRLTQQALADAVGIAQSTLSAFLKGKRFPTTAHAKRLGDHFGVSPTVFLPL